MTSTIIHPRVLRVQCSIRNGKYITNKNVDRIFAVSSELCTHVKSFAIDPKTYHEKWAVKKEPEGYIFREVTHGGGINGHHKTLRSLILQTCLEHGHKIKIIYQ